MIYRIRDWQESFETHETRKLDNLKWVAKPNKHDGLSFRRLAAHKDRCELYAAWTLILEVASRAKKGERGILARDGVGLTPEDLALMTGFPSVIFEKAFKFFACKDIAWLIPDVPASTAEDGKSPGESPAVWKEGMEGNERIERAPPDGREKAGNGKGRIPTTQEADRVSGIFGRKPLTPWSEKEIKVFKSLVPFNDDELCMVERYYSAEQKRPENHCRRDLQTLLNNYRGEVDRARRWCEAHPVKSKAVKFEVVKPKAPEISDEKRQEHAAKARALVEDLETKLRAPQSA